MRLLLASTLALLVAQAAPPQTDNFVAKLVLHRSDLSIRNGQLAGAGAEVLQSAIAQSRFVLLGEDHGAVQNAELMAALCTAVAAQHFRAIAIEEGPLAAAELENRVRRPDGLSQLAAFEQAFPSSLGVYNAREEVDALQHCAQAAPDAFHLWGLNQEGLNGAGLILSRVLASPGLGADARAAMQQLVKKNDDAYQRALRTGSIFDFFMMAADEKELAADAALLRTASPAAQSLFRSLIESHAINGAPPVDYTNARQRERLMKMLFAANFTRAAAASTPPKVLLRFGAYHLYRGLNPVHGSGLGNYVAELAEAQGAQSLHIRLMPVKGSQPIHPRVGQPAQLRAFNYFELPAFRYMQPIFGNLLPSGWTLFDLRPLRREWNALGVRDSELTTLVFGYDILVLVPDARPSTDIG